MADVISIKVIGLEKLHDALKQLPANIARNGLRASVRAGAVVIQKDAKQRVPVQSGVLKKSVYVKQIRELSNDQRQTFYVGVRQGPKRKKDGSKDYSGDAFYWRFVEFGHKALNGAHVAAKPFLRPAYETQKENAVQAVQDKLAAVIERETEKLKWR